MKQFRIPRKDKKKFKTWGKDIRSMTFNPNSTATATVGQVREDLYHVYRRWSTGKTTEQSTPKTIS